MEPSAKRQKVFAELDLAPGLAKDSDAYSDVEDDEVSDEDEFPREVGYDPDEEFVQRRAQLNYKLKSTFESIFEKYGKDFEGVGDEIDLRTGEIIVDNGHLAEMQNERDAGGKRVGRKLLRALTVEPDIAMESMTDNVTETSEDDEDEVADSQPDIRDTIEVGVQDTVEVSDDDGDMMEDDLILRGSETPNQGHHVDELSTAEVDSVRKNGQFGIQQHSSPNPGKAGSTFPSYNEILKSFGPAVAPQIVGLLAHSQGQDDGHIEPAWRAPYLPSTPAGRRPALKTFIPQLEMERTPSPNVTDSIWALPKTRGRLGGSASKIVTSDAPSSDNSKEPGSVRKRNRFTEDDDEWMVARVAEARRQGLSFWSDSMWTQLEAENSRHPKGAWKMRYRNYYMHLWSGESPSSSNNYRSPARSNKNGIGGEVENEQTTSPNLNNPGAEAVEGFAGPSASSSAYSQRPARIRRLARQGSDIVSWSDAVAAIKALDPRLHKDLVNDARAYDFSDVNHANIGKEASDLGTSDLELSGSGEEEQEIPPQCPAQIGTTVQRIPPIIPNPSYEFSDDEALPVLDRVLQLAHASPLQGKRKTGRSRKTQPKDSKGRKSMPSSTTMLPDRLGSDDMDELSFVADDSLYIRSLPKIKPQKSFVSKSVIEDGDKEVSTDIQTIVPRSRKVQVRAIDSFDEVDELGGEWEPSISMPTPVPRLQNFAGEHRVGAAEHTDTYEEDIFDIGNAADTSPKSALEARSKARALKKSNHGAQYFLLPSMSHPTKASNLLTQAFRKKMSDAVEDFIIASTSSQDQSSPTIAVQAKSRPKLKNKMNSTRDDLTIPSTSSPVELSPTPRAKRKYTPDRDEEPEVITPLHSTNSNVITPTSNASAKATDMTRAGASVTKHQATNHRAKGGIITPTHSEMRKSRTPLLDFITPTRSRSENRRSERIPQSPAMVTTPGGTSGKCGRNGFTCKKSFCFRCGMGSQRVDI